MNELVWFGAGYSLRRTRGRVSIYASYMCILARAYQSETAYHAKVVVTGKASR